VPPIFSEPVDKPLEPLQIPIIDAHLGCFCHLAVALQLPVAMPQKMYTHFQNTRGDYDNLIATKWKKIKITNRADTRTHKYLTKILTPKGNKNSLGRQIQTSNDRRAGKQSRNN